MYCVEGSCILQADVASVNQFLLCPSLLIICNKLPFEEWSTFYSASVVWSYFLLFSTISLELWRLWYCTCFHQWGQKSLHENLMRWINWLLMKIGNAIFIIRMSFLLYKLNLKEVDSYFFFYFLYVFYVFRNKFYEVFYGCVWWPMCCYGCNFKWERVFCTSGNLLLVKNAVGIWCEVLSTCCGDVDYTLVGLVNGLRQL